MSKSSPIANSSLGVDLPHKEHLCDLDQVVLVDLDLTFIGD